MPPTAFPTSLLSSGFIYSSGKGFSLAISSTLSIGFSSSGSFGFSVISGISIGAFSALGTSIGGLFGSAIFDGGFIFEVSPNSSPISTIFDETFSPLDILPASSAISATFDAVLAVLAPSLAPVIPLVTTANPISVIACPTNSALSSILP